MKELTAGELFNRLSALIQTGLFNPSMPASCVLDDKEFRELVKQYLLSAKKAP